MDSMLDKILTEKFRKTLRSVFKDIQHNQNRRELEKLVEDELRIKEKLLATVNPYPSDVVLGDDYLVAAVDGSGTDRFVVHDDIRVHMLSTSTVVLDTNTRSEFFFAPIDKIHLENELGEQPDIDAHWHSSVPRDARKKMTESLENIYPQKNIVDLVLPFFRDYSNGKIDSFSDFSDTEFASASKKLREMEDLVSRSQSLTNIVIHDELRKVSEYAAIRTLLTSDIDPKFVLIDGAMSVFMHPTKHYPSMPSGFMLRDLCSLARQKGVILCAVSKNHTIPFAHKIAKMAKEKFGDGAKWFCHLPSKFDPGGGLRIIEDRPYIPPMLAVPYLFSFSRDNRPSRIDFDRIWWLQNIFVSGDPRTTRENEKALFREIEFMSRDARWYGYPVPLALAHESCKLSYEDLLLAREICRDILKEVGLGDWKTQPLREDYNQ